MISAKLATRQRERRATGSVILRMFHRQCAVHSLPQKLSKQPSNWWADNAWCEILTRQHWTYTKSTDMVSSIDRKPAIATRAGRPLRLHPETAKRRTAIMFWGSRTSPHRRQQASATESSMSGSVRAASSRMTTRMTTRLVSCASLQLARRTRGKAASYSAGATARYTNHYTAS